MKPWSRLYFRICIFRFRNVELNNLRLKTHPISHFNQYEANFWFVQKVSLVFLECNYACRVMKTFVSSAEKLSCNCNFYAAVFCFQWPYCAKRCSYCNFNKYIKKNIDHARMKQCLTAEITTLFNLSAVKTTRSIFFGGGKIGVVTFIGLSLERPYLLTGLNLMYAILQEIHEFQSVNWPKSNEIHRFRPWNPQISFHGNYGFLVDSGINPLKNTQNCQM